MKRSLDLSHKEALLRLFHIRVPGGFNPEPYGCFVSWLHFWIGYIDFDGRENGVFPVDTVRSDPNSVPSEAKHSDIRPNHFVHENATRRKYWRKPILIMPQLDSSVIALSCICVNHELTLGSPAEEENREEQNL